MPKPSRREGDNFVILTEDEILEEALREPPVGLIGSALAGSLLGLGVVALATYWFFS